MNFFSRLATFFKNAHWIWIVTLLAASLSGQVSSETLAAVASPTTLPEKASVVVDGRPVFQVENSGDFTAQQRAVKANQLLEELAESPEQAKVEVVEHNQQPILLANEQYLLTVTAPDTSTNKTPSQQAQVWASQIERSLHSSKQERSPSHLRDMTLLTSLTLLMAVTLHISLGYICQRSAQYASVASGYGGSGYGGSGTDTSGYSDSRTTASESDETKVQIPQLSSSLKLWLFRCAIWVVSLSHISSLFPALRQQRYSLFNNFITAIQAPILSSRNRAYSLIDLLMLVALVIVLFTLVRVATRLLATRILKRTPLARGSREVITQSFRYGAFSLGMFVLLQLWGIDLRSITLLGSALGIGIGFGLQDIAKNFGSGLVLLFERSVQVGDFIEIGSHSGTVERIGARSITIRTLDHISVLVPNAHLLDSQVINWNHDHAISRLHIVIGTAYEADSQLVKSLLLQAAQENEEVLPMPAPNVFLKTFADSAIEFDLMVWIRNPERHAAIRSALNFRIEALLTQHEISIPFPQRDVNLQVDSMPIEFSPDIEAALLGMIETNKKPDTVPLRNIKGSVRSFYEDETKVG
ncbi:MAG: mechanosensitive ion channel domain-containing protein [Cyanobacteria bacterium P01_D01_bin.105]